MNNDYVRWVAYCRCQSTEALWPVSSLAYRVGQPLRLDVQLYSRTKTKTRI